MRDFASLLMGVFLLASPHLLWARPEIHVLIAGSGEWPSGIEKSLQGVSNQLRQFDLVILERPATVTAETPSVDELLTKAEATFEQSNPEATHSAYDAAIATLEKTGRSQRPMPDLFFSMARFFYTQNETTRAKQALIEAATLDLSFSPDPIKYSPKLLKLYAEARKEVSQQPTITLTIEAPADATIWVDGYQRQSTCTVTIGEHYLRVEQEGALPFVQKISLTEAVTLKAKLAPDLAAQDLARRALAERDPYSALGWAQETGIKDLLVLSAGSEPWELTHLRVSEQKIIAKKETSAATLEQDISALLEPVGPLTIPSVLPSDEPRPFWRAPAFWVPAGAVVLTGVALLSVDLFIERNGASPTIELRRRQ